MSPDDDDLFTWAPTAKELRDEGIRSVLEDEEQWKDTVHRIIFGLPEGWEGTGEDIRLICERAGIGAPHHHNCWGGAIMAAKRSGVLVATGRWVNMKTPKSHARASQVYRR
jgi:hypothetical protein